MAKKRYRTEQIIQLLREVEIHTSEGKTISQSSRQIGVTEQTDGTSCSMENLYPPEGGSNTDREMEKGI